MPLFTTPLTVQPWELALERRDGAPSVVLEPGRHRRRPRATYQTVDLRERLTQLAPQDVLTADGVTVKVSVVLRWAVVDAVRFTETATDPVGPVYLATQLALREALAPLEVESLVRTVRAVATDAIAGAASAAGETVGVGVREVIVKDVILPADLRAAYSELVVGRQRAQAQLEAARAETAALRSLANGAQLLDSHPALAQLRLVQALPVGSKVELVQPARD